MVNVRTYQYAITGRLLNDTWAASQILLKRELNISYHIISQGHISTVWLGFHYSIADRRWWERTKQIGLKYHWQILYTYFLWPRYPRGKWASHFQLTVNVWITLGPIKSKSFLTSSFSVTGPEYTTWSCFDELQNKNCESEIRSNPVILIQKRRVP